MTTHLIIGFESDIAVCGMHGRRHTYPQRHQFIPCDASQIRSSEYVHRNVNCPTCHRFIEEIRLGSTVEWAMREALR